MENHKHFISSEVLFPIILETLEDGKKASFTITGMSMWPFLCHNRDRVVLERCDWNNLKKGDAVLLQTPLGNYMFHRIISLKEDSFETTGDGNCFRDGFFPKDCMKARACRFIRKGREIDCDSLRWRATFAFWEILFPIRGLLLRLLKIIGRIKGIFRNM